MRIRSSGSGSSGFGGGGSRSDSFKQGRRPGQKVRGTLIKWISNNMAWVNIEGHKLLAQLQSTPPEGAQLTFLIKQIHPDIVLKEIFEISSAGASAIGLANNFDTSRTLFENQFRQYAHNLDKTPYSDRLIAFTDLLTLDRKLFASFIDTFSCMQNINSHIDTAKSGHLLFQPWLLPEGRRHISISRGAQKSTENPQLSQSIMECELGNFGMIRVEFLYKHPDTGYRVKLQHIAKAEKLKQYLSSRSHQELSGTIECLGVGKLPPTGHGGILAELMFAQ